MNIENALASKGLEVVTGWMRLQVYLQHGGIARLTDQHDNTFYLSVNKGQAQITDIQPPLADGMSVVDLGVIAKEKPARRVPEDSPSP